MRHTGTDQARLPSPERIVFTQHADARLHERAGDDFDLDRARTEIAEALLSQRFEWRARNIWYARARDRLYVLAVQRRDRVTVVITVLTESAPV